MYYFPGALSSLKVTLSKSFSDNLSAPTILSQTVCSHFFHCYICVEILKH